MTLDEIKAAVAAGKTVHWANTAYTVLHDTKNGCDQWLIAYCHGQRDANYIGLTHQDGVTMNGAPEQFFVWEKPAKKKRYFTFLVVGIYEEDNQRFADSYDCADAAEAEELALAEHPGLIIAGVLNARGEVVS